MKSASLVQRVSLLASIGIFVSTILVMGIALARDMTRTVEAERELLLSYSAVFSAAVAPSLAEGDRSGAVAALSGISKLPRITHARIVNLEGRTFTSVGTDYIVEGGVADVTSKPSLMAAAQPRFAVTQDVVRGGVVRGQILILSDTAFLRERLFSGIGQILLIALLLAGLSAMVSFVFLRSAIRPVARLTQAIEVAVEEKRFAERVDTQRRDEIGRLGHSFNEMMSGLEERDRVIRRQVETLEDTVEERTQQYRAARDEAEQANAAKSDFLATMSHEIRTPLNGMLVMAELLANGQLPSRQKRFADVIQSSGQSLLAIINDILDLSKIEASRLELEAVPVDLNALIENTTGLFSGRAREKQLSIGVFVAPGTPRIVKGDPTRITQILTNLLNNALKFTETGGVAIHIYPLKGDAGIRMSVIDTGIGIPKDRLETIFEAFAQADQSTTRKYGGTGLGLSICQKLVAAMGGEINVRSEPGRGSIFSCRLPLREVEAALPPKKDHGRSVLLLHQEDVASRFLGLMLLSQGFEVWLQAETQRPARDQEGVDYVLGPSSLLRRFPEAGDGCPPRICLTDFGDRDADLLVDSGEAEMVFSLPAGPDRVRDLADRLINGRLGDARTSPPYGEATTDAEEYFGSLRILGADDNPVNREVLHEALSALGVQAELFASAIPLLERAPQAGADLVFLDISMPEMDGVEALARLRAMALDPEPRIIALTAHVSADRHRELNAAGFETIVSKPFTVARIAEVLRTAQLYAPKAASDVPQLEEASAAIWDRDVLAEFEQATGRTGFAERMIALFRSNCVEGLRKIAERQGAADAGVAEAAHAFKSMATTVGAIRLAELCQDLEDKPDTLSPDTLAELARVLKATLQAMDMPITEAGGHMTDSLEEETG